LIVLPREGSKARKEHKRREETMSFKSKSEQLFRFQRVARAKGVCLDCGTERERETERQRERVREREREKERETERARERESDKYMPNHPEKD
jgi:hypothetical protein